MPLRGLFRSCESRRTRNAWDGSFIWLVTSISRPIGQKRRRRTGAKMWGRTRTKPRVLIESGKTNPLRRDMSVCYCTVKETATKASLS